MTVLFQLGLGNGDITSWVFMMILWVAFFFFYPRLMLSQIMWKIEKTAAELEEMSNKTRRFLLKEISDSPTQKTKDSVDRFFEFFMVSPVSADPFGVIKKMELIIQNEKERFRYFADQVAPKMDEDNKANLQMGFAGGIELHMIAKIVRHYVEMIKETKSYQIAMILQMQMPMIEKIAKAIYKGTETLAHGEPVGDALGPLVIANLMGSSKITEIEEDIVMAKIKIENRNIFAIKAKGPGGRLGRPGKAVEKIVSRNRISRIITIDAAAKLEGEKTGSVAEGVGVVMGGPGVERSFIEDVAVKNSIPLDSIVVKMKQEEAIMPMPKAVKDAVPKVIEYVTDAIRRAKTRDNIIVVGVGNTSGVGNSEKEAIETGKWVDKNERKMKSKKKKKSGWM